MGCQPGWPRFAARARRVLVTFVGLLRLTSTSAYLHFGSLLGLSLDCAIPAHQRRRHRLLPRADARPRTSSQVDGWTLPYKVEVTAPPPPPHPAPTSSTPGTHRVGPPPRGIVQPSHSPWRLLPNLGAMHSLWQLVGECDAPRVIDCSALALTSCPASEALGKSAKIEAVSGSRNGNDPNVPCQNVYDYSP